ncbi:hypothetical protein K440DRAFT_603650 [Wilcoxina mikolae CBS 423.85]|nr:hypothetical protein K440DRAFT_603650 [Wilcoxina mikolae CBS 423.85]
MATVLVKPTILIFGTCDTKLDPLLLLRSLILSHTPTPAVLLADVGRTPVSHPLIDIPQSSLLPPDTDVSTLPRNTLITTMAAALTSYIRTLHTAGKIHATISIGGSGGTTLAATAMRDALPIGFPKLIVTTMASGDVSHYVGDSDITLMPSIVDIAGTNPLLTKILRNAAGAIAGMSFLSSSSSPSSSPQKKPKTVAITMFGITTPAVTFAHKFLEARGYEVYIFHATGSGGRVMERLITEGAIDGVLDITTTELADELFGGVLSAGPDRLTAAGKVGIPQVISVGATDCINFGPVETLPEKFQGEERKVVVHNPCVTLVRTSIEECEVMGKCLVEKLRGVRDTEAWFPTRGVSALSAEGGVFCDFEADRKLRDVVVRSGVETVVVEGNVNDKVFAEAMAERLVKMMEG